MNAADVDAFIFLFFRKRNLARAAELDVFMDPEIFNAFLPSFLYRHEWPQMEDWKRGSSSKKDKGRELFQKYGLLHLARYIRKWMSSVSSHG